MINGNTCNGHNPAGCSQAPASAPAGFGAVGIAIDPASHQVVATNIEDTSSTTINGHACNALDSEGCDRTHTQAIVGDYPDGITIDPAVATAYIADSEGISVAPLRPRDCASAHTAIWRHCDSDQGGSQPARSARNSRRGRSLVSCLSFGLLVD